MIRKLQYQFIAIAMCSMAFVLALIIVGINLVNHVSVTRTLDERLEILAENDGAFPTNGNSSKPNGSNQSGGSLGDSNVPDDLPSDSEAMAKDGQNTSDSAEGSSSDSSNADDNNDSNIILSGNSGRRNGLTAEAAYDTRYFTITLHEDGTVYATDTGKISAVSSADAADYATALFAKDKGSGYVDIYRYCTTPIRTYNLNDGSSGETLTMYIFLDCERELSQQRSYILASVAISIAGLLLVFLLVVLLSGRAFRPVKESYAKQKQFITDASHEIKTPLTIIDANTEIIEMTDGENEWTQSIRNQISRLTALTERLVFLTRMDEDNTKLVMLDFSLSDAVTETVEPFRALAQTHGLALTCEVEPTLSLRGNEAQIRQLLEILLDNAVKYASAPGEIRVALTSGTLGRKLTVYNTVNAITPGNLDRLFDRFYRGDSSRSQQISGYGIGLSVAYAIVQAHKGKITARSEDGKSILFTILL